MQSPESIQLTPQNNKFWLNLLDLDGLKKLLNNKEKMKKKFKIYKPFFKDQQKFHPSMWTATITWREYTNNKKIETAHKILF
jgi:hypothetical protein